MVCLNWDAIVCSFRIPCALKDADFVQITQSQNRVSMSKTAGKLTLWYRAAKAWLRRVARARDTHTSWVRVHRTQSGTPYFMFESKRYTIADAGAHEVKQTFGVTHRDFHNAAGGLGADAVAKELDRVGQNIIPYQVDSLIRAIQIESFNIPFLYQMAVYMNW